MPEASLIITNSGVPGFVPEPGFIATGELILNWADGALYYKDTEGVVQSITTAPPTLELDHIPVAEGIFPGLWLAYTFPSNPANTSYIPVQKSAGTLPRLKIGSIASGENTVEVTDEDITVSILAGTTTNQIKGLIESNAASNALIYFYNIDDSDGTGVATPDPIGSAVFVNANAIGGDRADYLGQTANTTHTSEVLNNIINRTEWAAVKLRPTVWAPRTAGVIYNHDTSKWEVLRVESGTIQTILLPDQA